MLLLLRAGMRALMPLVFVAGPVDAAVADGPDMTADAVRVEVVVQVLRCDGIEGPRMCNELE